MKIGFQWELWTIGIEFRPGHWFVIHLLPLKIWWILVDQGYLTGK